jgi:hypothetical protein
MADMTTAEATQPDPDRLAPEMVEAGMAVILDTLRESDGVFSARKLAERVYHAMDTARRR